MPCWTFIPLWAFFSVWLLLIFVPSSLPQPRTDWVTNQAVVWDKCMVLAAQALSYGRYRERVTKAFSSLCSIRQNLLLLATRKRFLFLILWRGYSYSAKVASLGVFFFFFFSLRKNSCSYLVKAGHIQWRKSLLQWLTRRWYLGTPSLDCPTGVSQKLNKKGLMGGNIRHHHHACTCLSRKTYRMNRTGETKKNDLRFSVTVKGLLVV